MTARIPPQLVDAFRDRRAAVFVGAGVSMSAGLPGWHEVVASLARHLNLPDDSLSTDALLRVPQYYRNRLGAHALQNKLEGLIPAVSPSEAHRLSAKLPCDLFYTTNFDELLERSLEERRAEKFPVIVSEEEAQFHSDRSGLQVRKIHGSITRPGTLVITREDFATVRKERPVLVDTLRSHLRSNSFLFIGYSLNDPDFAAIYDEVFLAMGEFHQKHFIALPEASDLEREDLRGQGLEPINILDWDPKRESLSAGLEGFLTDLVAQTDDLAHISRFFGPLGRRHSVPIVMSSQAHPAEKYIYVAECDLVVAAETERILDQLGCTGSRIADHRAMQETEQLLSGDLIIICSPFGNEFAAMLFEKAAEESDHQFASVAFVEKGAGRAIVGPNGAEFFAGDPVMADGATRKTEHALIARYPNPWSPGKSIFMFAGLYAVGTHAVGEFMRSADNFREFPDAEASIEAVLTIEFTEHDPYDYKYEVAGLSVIET